MKIAFLNLCHTDPAVVARAAKRLTNRDGFDMYVHVDLKSDITPFERALSGVPRVFFTNERVKVYWGGFNSITATIILLREALASPERYDYFVILQNFDYPIRGNDYIARFFTERAGTEFLRGCDIARTRDWHYARKYKIYNSRDDDFYLTKHSKARMYLRYASMRLRSVKTIFFNGTIREGERYDIHYGAAQWAVTRALAEYFADFYGTHPRFNRTMRRIQSPDEAYFQTVLHNSPYKFKCVKYDEPVARWLVNWRNLHYFEFPREVKVMTEADFDTIAAQDALFVRKVRTGASDGLLDRLDKMMDNNNMDKEGAVH